VPKVIVLCLTSVFLALMKGCVSRGPRTLENSGPDFGSIEKKGLTSFQLDTMRQLGAKGRETGLLTLGPQHYPTILNRSQPIAWEVLEERMLIFVDSQCVLIDSDRPNKLPATRRVV
jgi:hypothetical protein